MDAVVTASPGHGAMFDLLVGSIGQAMLRAAKVPVLVVLARD